MMFSHLRIVAIRLHTMETTTSEKLDTAQYSRPPKMRDDLQPEGSEANDDQILRLDTSATSYHKPLEWARLCYQTWKHVWIPTPSSNNIPYFMMVSNQENAD